MRTDCTIDNKPINCPYADSLGYGKRVANAGDLIVYKETYTDGSTGQRVARVLGCVDAPANQPGGKPVKGFALVMALATNCTHAYERWIDPQDIIEVRDVPTQMLALFSRATLPDVHLLRRKMESGYIAEHYLKDAGLDLADTTAQGETP